MAPPGLVTAAGVSIHGPVFAVQMGKVGKLVLRKPGGRPGA